MGDANGREGSAPAELAALTPGLGGGARCCSRSRGRVGGCRSRLGGGRMGCRCRCGRSCSAAWGALCWMACSCCRRRRSLRSCGVGKTVSMSETAALLRQKSEGQFGNCSRHASKIHICSVQLTASLDAKCQLAKARTPICMQSLPTMHKVLHCRYAAGIGGSKRPGLTELSRLDIQGMP